MKRDGNTYWISAIAVAVAIAAGVLFRYVGKTEKSITLPSNESKVRVENRRSVKKSPSADVEISKRSSVASEGHSDLTSRAEKSETHGNRREALTEEGLVNEFYDLTEKWMSDDGSVGIDDVQRFKESFRKIPQARRDECLQRALNLISNKNVMLLVGILMDKSFDTSTLEMIFNDILNRDEMVKKTILHEVYKDKTHPCWADTAWILDVTGELSGKKND